MSVISDSQTTLSLLRDRAERFGDRVYASFDHQKLTVGGLYDQVRQTAARLSIQGISRGDRVAVMLDNHLDNLVLFFALIWVGAVHVPVNTRLRHASLDYVIEHAEPRMIVVEESFSGLFADISGADGIPVRTRRLSTGFDWGCEGPDNTPDCPVFDPEDIRATDVLFIMYTSGTTGPPKGVMVTDKMLRASSYASAQSSAAKMGDIFLVWEPLYHIGAIQLLPLALDVGVELALVGRFSASRFWEQVSSVRATQIHFLGGILQILLRQPPTIFDRQHRCRVAWGGGAPAHVAQDFEARFAIEVRENYGMTEASSLTSFNLDGHKGSVGRPVPYFDVRVVDETGAELAQGQTGEIIVKAREPGLITPGYFRNEAATRAAIRDGWLYTGDLGFLDDKGYLFYSGRVKDNIRRRGENISAWEIERVVEQLEFVEQAAAIAVPDDFGDEEIKLFVQFVAVLGVPPSADDIFDWCIRRLPEFQVPRYLSFVDSFPMTGTERIQKELLSNSTEDCAVRS